MSVGVVNATPDELAAAQRIRKFIDEWGRFKDKGDLIYGLHTGVEHREAALTVADLETVLRRFPRLPVPPVPPVYGPPSGRFIPCTDPECGMCHGSGEFATGAGYTRAWVPCGKWREYADDPDPVDN